MYPNRKFSIYLTTKLVTDDWFIYPLSSAMWSSIYIKNMKHFDPVQLAPDYAVKYWTSIARGLHDTGEGPGCSLLAATLVQMKQLDEIKLNYILTTFECHWK